MRRYESSKPSMDADHEKTKASASRPMLQPNKVQRKASHSSHILSLQKTLGNQAVQRMLSRTPLQKSENLYSGSGRSLPDSVQAKMEKAFHTDFSDVQIHPESSVASQIGAVAFAQGNDIHFAPGTYQPETQSGQQLLGHELTHVVQQRQGRVKANVPDASLPINDDPALEAEADRYGSLAAAGTMTDGRDTADTGSSVPSPIIQGTWDEDVKDARRMWDKHVEKTNNLDEVTVNELFEQVDDIENYFDKIRYGISLHAKISDIFSVTGGNYTELEEAQRLFGEHITPFFGKDKDTDPDIDYTYLEEQHNDTPEEDRMLEDEEDSTVLYEEKRVAMEIKTISSHDDLQIGSRIHEAIGQLDKRRDMNRYKEYVIVIQKYHPENPWPYTATENRASAPLVDLKTRLTARLSNMTNLPAYDIKVIFRGITKGTPTGGTGTADPTFLIPEHIRYSNLPSYTVECYYCGSSNTGWLVDDPIPE
ncbi:DUF4157 domain-containing protein [Brevibacillus formosus]|uniref:eCIS core domain-containing protein n=1 Tax=Brevibacillus formosus TaxID=54913 RepID=A0A837KMR1_9BACL|nr:DUF4157 domain-containing protein [Brevibacillus formosus]KLH97916.1 hypothetical protein AA984_18815 [Brevibacillus formosus]MED1957270.1 DUF4157 domain-containing protein [Brevibacillus formosus]PSJ91343.1 DUF4157 domain-containing protein [Brevibacillus formosus]GED57382.1 hypothetical protein BFO01nite_15140 [Brevibacillus formosus]